MKVLVIILFLLVAGFLNWLAYRLSRSREPSWKEQIAGHTLITLVAVLVTFLILKEWAVALAALKYVFT